MSDFNLYFKITPLDVSLAYWHVWHNVTWNMTHVTRVVWAYAKQFSSQFYCKMLTSRNLSTRKSGGCLLLKYLYFHHMWIFVSIFATLIWTLIRPEQPHMSNVINVSEGDFQNVLDQFKDILNREGWLLRYFKVNKPQLEGLCVASKFGSCSFWWKFLKNPKNLWQTLLVIHQELFPVGAGYANYCITFANTN